MFDARRSRLVVRRFVTATLGLGHSVLGVAVASATIVVPADFSEMVGGSQTIVHGRVSDVRSQMTGARRSIESVVTVEVTASLKGEARASVVFRVPNGQVGRYRRITVGAPELARGDEVIVFLEGRAPALPMPFGLTQGVYRVARAADGGAVVTPLLASDPGRVVRGDPARRPLPVEAFSRHVRAMVTPR
jgi:hypothetical protein